VVQWLQSLPAPPPLSEGVLAMVAQLEKERQEMEIDEGNKTKGNEVPFERDESDRSLILTPFNSYQRKVVYALVEVEFPFLMAEKIDNAAAQVINLA